MLSRDARWARAGNDRMIAAALPALRRLAEIPSCAPEGAPVPAVAGAGGTGTFAELTPFITAAAREMGVGDARRAALLRGVRRFSNAEAVGIGRWEKDAPRDLLAVVDRVDALVILYGAVPVSRPNALIRSAHGLLWTVLRDTSAIEQIAAATYRTDESTWRAADVAMGLLGTSPLALPLPLSDDPWNVRALILGATLADPANAGQALWGAKAMLWAGAEELAEHAMRRLDLGRLMTVIG